jgi:MATE family multidrug resistance protein
LKIVQEFIMLKSLMNPALRSARQTDWLEELKALFALAGPLVLTQLAQMAIMTTDVLLLGRLSTHALAAAAIGNTVYYFCWLAATGPAQAVSPMVAQLTGELSGRKLALRPGVRATVRMGLWAAVFTTLPLILVLANGGWILKHLGQEASLAEDAGRFTLALCVGFPFTIGFQVLRNFTTAMEHPRVGLWVMLASIVWNAVAGYALIFGHFGMPKLGIAGSGIATASSSVFSFFLLAALVQGAPDLRAFRLYRRFFVFKGKVLAELFRLGGPIGLTMLFEAMLFNVMTLLVGAFGAAPLAAHQIALNVASFTFMVPLGVAMAATVRVGQFAGADDLPGARRAGFVAMAACTALAGVTATVMLTGGRWLAGLYVPGRDAQDLQVISLTAQFLMVGGVFQLADALQVVGNLCLRGLKDARAPMIIAAASYWLAGAPVCVLLGVTFHMQGLGVWIGLAFGLAVAAVLMCTRFVRMTRG